MIRHGGDSRAGQESVRSAGAEPLLLALDSTGLSCSVVVALGARILADERIDSLHGQAEILLPLVDKAMREARQVPGAIEVVTATIGPGSFTGIRAGLAAARGIALATGARLIGVTSFDAVAARAIGSEYSEARLLLIALESRRKDLYIQFVDLGGGPLGEPAAVLPCALAEVVNAVVGAQPLLIAGDAAQRATAALAQRPQTAVFETTGSGAVGALRAGLRVLELGKAIDAVRPLYLRPPDVTFPGGPWKRSQART